jgi:4-methoxybenzoate monooxygenase (O-demethylating)
MSTDIARLDIDPFAIDNLISPYAWQQAIRDAGPIAWLNKYHTYAVGRHDSVMRVLEDPVKFCSAGGVGLPDVRKPGSWRAASPLVEVDPPRHTEIRSAMNRILSPAVINSWRARFHEAAVGLCDQVLASGEVDGLEQIAQAYVHNAFPSVLGVERHSRNLLIVGHHSANASGPQNELFRQSQAELEGIWDWYQFQQTKEAMIPGGFGEQVFLAEERGQLPPGVAPGLLRTLVRGGSDTTISGLATTLWKFAVYPDQFRLVKEDPGKWVGAAFEEALRLESPTAAVYRTTTDEATFDGIALQPDTKVQVCIGAANRDPRRYGEDVEHFCVQRDLRNNLDFGAGPHKCLGQKIAKLEAESLLTEFLKRVKSIEMAGEPEFRPVNMLRTLRHLPLRITLH